jgi:hypothetical protein
LASQLYGWNMHIWDLTMDQLVDGQKLSIAGQTIFLLGVGLTKVSILHSYLAIAPPNSYFRLLTKWAFALVTGATFIFLVVLWMQCLYVQVLILARNDVFIVLFPSCLLSFLFFFSFWLFRCCRFHQDVRCAGNCANRSLIFHSQTGISLLELV